MTSRTGARCKSNEARGANAIDDDEHIACIQLALADGYYVHTADEHDMCPSM